jgi:hypothetical protein
LAALLGAGSWANLALRPEPSAPGLKLSPDVGLRPLLLRPEEVPALPTALPPDAVTTPLTIPAVAPLTALVTVPVNAQAAEPRKFSRPPALSLKLGPLSELTEEESRGIDPLQPTPSSSKDDPL